jgi:hypothetical protein
MACQVVGAGLVRGAQVAAGHVEADGAGHPVEVAADHDAPARRAATGHPVEGVPRGLVGCPPGLLGDAAATLHAAAASNHRRGGAMDARDDRFGGDTHAEHALFDEAAEWARSGRPYRHWEIGYALRTWRGHARQLARPALAAERAAYERAVALALPALERFTTIGGLVDHYLRDRGRCEGARAAPPGSVEEWVGAALAGVPGGERRLDRDVVEETAFWRRARFLIAEAAAR